MLLPWTFCLVDSQQPQIPNIKGEKLTFVAIIDYSLKFVTSASVSSLSTVQFVYLTHLRYPSK